MKRKSKFTQLELDYAPSLGDIKIEATPGSKESLYVKNFKTLSKDRGCVVSRMRVESLMALRKQEPPLVKHVHGNQHAKKTQDERCHTNGNTEQPKEDGKYIGNAFLPAPLNNRESRFSVYDDVLDKIPQPTKRKPDSSGSLPAADMFTPYPTMDDFTRGQSSRYLLMHNAREKIASDAIRRRLNEHVTEVIKEYSLGECESSENSDSTKSTPSPKRGHHSPGQKFDLKHIDSIITAREARSFKEQWDRFAAENKYVKPIDDEF